MKDKKRRYASILIVIVLLITIPIILYNYYGPGRKQIVAANKFIKKLQNENIIEKNNEHIKFQMEEKTGTDKENETYSLISNNYRIDLNKNYDVISFVDKMKVNDIINITPEDGEGIAKEYLSKICSGDYRVKEVNRNDLKDESPFYSIIFSKYEDGYPYYSEEVIININKNNGKLQGYVNKTKDDNHSDIKINISKETAEELALKLFKNVSNGGKIKGKSYLAFCNKKEALNKSELAYVVNVSNDKENMIYFISSDSGKLINAFSNTVKKAKVE